MAGHGGTMSKAAIALLALVLFASIALGLWDLIGGLNLLAGSVTLVFVAAGTFNTLSALSSKR
jgi:hypothetical protein